MGSPSPQPSDRAASEPTSLGRDLDPRARGAAHEDRRLLTLLEFGREAAETLDEPGLCSLGLLTLMGYTGTGRAALWLCDEAATGQLQLTDAHGLHPRALEAIAHGLDGCPRGPDVERASSVLLGAEFEGTLDEVTVARVREAGLSVLCVLMGGGEVLGYAMLGGPAGGEGGAAGPTFDRRVLDAACRMLGVSLVNARLIARLRARGEELARANQALARTNDELAELDRLKSNFLSNVNHELRTPVAVIQGAVGCLKVPGIGPEETARFVQMVDTSASRLAAMIQTLLDLSLLGARGPRSPLQPVDLTALAGVYHRGRRAKVEQGGRILEYVFAAEPVVCRGEEGRVYDVLERLVDNASRFTPQGTRITLRVAHEEDPDGRWASIAVEDDGPGIEDEKLRRIFEPFEQVDGSTTRAVGGLGIGLAVARRCAEVMGGALTVRSAPGRGSVFTLRLPAV